MSSFIPYLPASDLARLVIETHKTRSRTGCVGAASELLVCADLLRLGWNVFRSVSPVSPFDLIIVRDTSLLLRVEVRTAFNHKGKIACPKHGTYDVLAIVRDCEIVYRPELPTI